MARRLAALPSDVFEARLSAGRRGEGMLDRVSPRRKPERLIDDLRRSLPWFRAAEVRQLLDMLADRLEEMPDARLKHGFESRWGHDLFPRTFHSFFRISIAARSGRIGQQKATCGHVWCSGLSSSARRSRVA